MIIFRADGNKELGTGHIMRCLSLAKIFISCGRDCLFITADHQSDLLLNQAHVSSICLNSIWNNVNSEIECIVDIICSYKPEFVVLDHYYATSFYRETLRLHTRLICLSPLETADCHCDILINYRIGAEKETYSGDVKKLLLGPSYTPLREEFFDFPKKYIKKNVEDVFVSTGGSDPLGLMIKIIKMITENSCWKHINFHFIAGALNPYSAQIKIYQQKNKNINIHENVSRVSEIMKLCDIAISAAGTTLFELCACGVPTITYALADNQIRMANCFASLGLMISNGDYRGNEHFMSDLKEAMNILMGNFSKRCLLSQKMQALIDGRGAQRIADNIL